MSIKIDTRIEHPKEIILYNDSPEDRDEPDIHINFKNNLFLEGVSIYTFIKRVRETLSYVNSDLLFEPAYPDWIINHSAEVKQFKPAITWEVRSMMPAQLGGSPDPSSRVGTKEIKPRLRVEVESGEKTYRVLGQMFDCFIDFVVWDSTAARAEQNAQWFQTSFMSNFSGLFGSPQVHFYQRSQDKELLKINNLLQTRTLTYYAQLAENYAVEAEKIQEIKLKLDSQV